MKIILASKSPRRSELMGLICGDIVIEEAAVDERLIESEYRGRPEGLSEVLAAEKAKAVFGKAKDIYKDEDFVVIGADTSVITGDEILGKPADREDALRMLTTLSGITHKVVTGVALEGTKGSSSFSETSLVTFNDLDDIQAKTINHYIDTKDPYDKAGAYGIQSGGSLLVKEIKGDYFNIVGLPVNRLARELRSSGYL